MVDKARTDEKGRETENPFGATSTPTRCGGRWIHGGRGGGAPCLKWALGRRWPNAGQEESYRKIKWGGKAWTKKQRFKARS